MNAAEAKQRMMAMEQQLSQLSQMVTKVEDGNKIFEIKNCEEFGCREGDKVLT